VGLAERGLAGSAVSSSTSADRYQIHVELNNDTPHLRDGAGLTQAVVERLCCDASLVGHKSHDIDAAIKDGRKTRVVAPATRRALARRDGGCRFPGCTHQRFVDAHHVKHWAHGGETRLTNLVLLCRRHHVLVHEGGFRVKAEHPAKGATRFNFYTPKGDYMPPVADDLSAGDVKKLLEKNSAESRRGSVESNDAADVADAIDPIDSNDLIDPTDLEPIDPIARPDYSHINWVLSNVVPLE